MQAYVHKLAQCLVDLDGSDDLRHSANAQMQQWRVEMMALFLCFVAGNPKVKADLLSLNMEDGTMHEDRKPISIQDDLLVSSMTYLLFVATRVEVLANMVNTRRKPNITTM